MDVGRTGARGPKTAGPANDLPVLLDRKLAEAAPPLNPQRILGDELLDIGSEESDALPPADIVAAGDEAVGPPPRDRLGGNVEPAGELLDGEHAIEGHGLNRPCAINAGADGLGGGLGLEIDLLFHEQAHDRTLGIRTHCFPPWPAIRSRSLCLVATGPAGDP